MLEQALLRLVAPELAGDPSTGMQWVRRSLRSLEARLNAGGHGVSHETIRRMLGKHKIAPMSNVKRLVSKPHPDRDKQFGYIERQRERFKEGAWPIISVDTKKKELIGLFKNPGQVWTSEPASVYMHDFPGDAIARAVPYGIYDVEANLGYIFVGLSADTPDFAVDCIVNWWQSWGQLRYSTTAHLLILADAGGSNGYRPRRWKYQLQRLLVDRFCLAVTVCHYPSGASKWNPIEHRLFSEISKTWSGTPLSSVEVMLKTIEATKTEAGLCVKARLIEGQYERGLGVSKKEMATLNLEKHQTCPNWNYTIRPR